MLSSSHDELAITFCHELISLEFSLRSWSWQALLLCKWYPPDVKCIMEINKEGISVSIARIYKITYDVPSYNKHHKITIKSVTKKLHHGALRTL